jgi:hypothetical protein
MVSHITTSRPEHSPLPVGIFGRWRVKNELQFNSATKCIELWKKQWYKYKKFWSVKSPTAGQRNLPQWAQQFGHHSVQASYKKNRCM